MKEIVNILMSRDGMSEKDAIKEVEAFKDFMNCQMAEGQYDFDDDFMSWFGLEPDYLIGLIGF